VVDGDENNNLLGTCIIGNSSGWGVAFFVNQAWGYEV